MIKKAIFFAGTMGIVVVMGMFVFLFLGIGKEKEKLPFVLLNTLLPTYAVEVLPDYQKKSFESLKGQVWLLNVFGSWCYACEYEHPFLMTIGDEVGLYGLNWQEKKDHQGWNWLQTHGNPYREVFYDRSGYVGIDLGVTGAPETFIIDKKGLLRYKHIGPLTAENWIFIVEKVRAYEKELSGPLAEPIP